MRELNPRAWIPSLNRYAIGFDDLYYHRQMNGEGEWWCCPAGEDEQLDVEIELSTGLKDKNGKEICIGDIVKVEDDKYTPDIDTFCGENAIVTMSELLKPGAFVVKNWYGERHLRWDISLSRVEVIGNIHQNPELLEAKNVD